MKRMICGAIAAMLPLLSSCSGGGGASSERIAAAQEAIDYMTPRATVYDGYGCIGQDYGMADIQKYTAVKEAHLGPIVSRSGQRCRLVSWDKGVPLVSKDMPNPRMLLGHNVIDKLGDDQEQMGSMYAPIRYHFEVSPLGQELISAGIGEQQSQKPYENSVAFGKDADGHLHGQLVDQGR